MRRARTLRVCALVAALVASGCISFPGRGGETEEPAPVPPSPAPPAPTTSAPPPPPKSTVTFGVALTPRDADNLAQFWDDADQAGGMVAWVGRISEMEQDNGPPQIAATVNAFNGLQTGIYASPYVETTAGFSRPFTPEQQEADRQTLVAFVDDYPVDWLILGAEVNFWREFTTDEDYQTFVDWYNRTYDAIKLESPSTKVFPSFQYERIVGRHGGLYGGAEMAATQWDVLDDFPKRDALAFTSYPSLVFEDPADIPPDYFQAMTEHDETLALAETGWHAGSVIVPGWDSSLEEQADYVDRLFEVLPPVKLVVWSFVYDQSAAPPPFDAMGLRDSGSGDARPSWNRWVAIKGRAGA